MLCPFLDDSSQLITPEGGTELKWLLNNDTVAPPAVHPRYLCEVKSGWIAQADLSESPIDQSLEFSWLQYCRVGLAAAEPLLFLNTFLMFL